MVACSRTIDHQLWRLGWICLGVWLSVGQLVRADEPAPSTPGVTCQVGASDGARRYRQGTWGVVEVFAVNRTDAFAEAETMAYFLEDPTLQFGRRVTIPPHSTVRTTCPLLIPTLSNPDAGSLYFLTEQIEPSPPAARKERTRQDVLLASQPLILDPEIPAVGMLADVDGVYPPPGYKPFHVAESDVPLDPDELAYEMVVAAKRGRELSRRVSVLDSKVLPPDPAILDVLDVLVLTTDRIATDPGCLTAIRDWVLAGGRLWIALDEIQADTVSALMGDAFATTVVDRVALTSVHLTDARLTSELRTSLDIELEEPAQLVRVIPEGVTVLNLVNGWPAAFWQSFGGGRVYFTTVSSSAWMRPVIRSDPPPRSQDDATAFYPREPLVDFAQECVVQRPEPELASATLQPFLTQQIGYRILGRTSVLVMLSLFCLGMLVLGWWLLKQGRGERLLWGVPVVAAVVSTVFLSTAMVTKKSVPPTVAMVARAAFEPGVMTAHTSGLAALYNQAASSERLGAEAGGVFFPDMSAMTGVRRRIVWTDEGKWHWSNLELPAGVRTAPFERPLPLASALECRAHFGPHGLEGILGSHPFGELRDAVIAVPHQRRLSVAFGDDGSFMAGPKQVLAEGDYSSGTLLGDEQVRRKSIYDQIFKATPEMDAPAEPVLYAWSDSCATGFEFPQTRQLPSTLISTRVCLEHSPPGTQVVIPATFLPYRAVADPEGRPASAYANSVHRWVESKLAVTDWLRFQLPAAVLPLKVQSAKLSWTINAASRSVQIYGVNGNEMIELRKLSRPIGTYSVVVDQPELLQLDADGGLRFVISVGADETTKPKDQMAVAPWKMESMQLEVDGIAEGE